MSAAGRAATIGAMLYLDHAATTPLRPEVGEAMAPFLGERFGNPSGAHRVARRAKNAIEEAREEAAELLGAQHPLDIAFTGGATEADNLAVLGAALAGGRRGGIVATAVEHEAVLEAARFAERLGCPATVVGVDQRGVAAPEDLAAACDADTAVVAVMAANNETGARQPVAKAARAVRAAAPEALVHCDAVQAFISEDVSVAALDVDLLALSAHKLGGPQGVGLLHVAPGTELEPVVHGGGQELGRRSGTHNVAGIVGMVAAMRATVDGRAAFRERVGEARRRFEDRVRAAAPDVQFTVPDGDRLVQHSHLRVPGIRADTMLILLDGAGLAASAGSACSSGAVETSHVLAAMGVDHRRAAECLRFTFGWDHSAEDGDTAGEIVAGVIGKLR